MPVHTIPIRPFTTPTSVQFDMPAGLRQDGFHSTPEIPLSELSRETVAALCAEFTSRVMTAFDQQRAAAARNAEDESFLSNPRGSR
jgi:hypothetical protein